ncbi:DUF1707 domain-containing protein [Nocardioides sp.]|uniref:DUF1707 domain-containing protein n=1 Tax=Nocardioides sp. TaxID=35761 RepID=UPI0037836AFF
MDDRLRIGDADRERAAAELGEHYVQGRLTTDEHAERLDRIWAARTRGELAPVFTDLPGRPGPADAATDRRTPSWPASRWRGRLPVPVAPVLAVLLVLTIATHVPFVLVGLVLVAIVARRRLATTRWSGAGPDQWCRPRR